MYNYMMVLAKQIERITSFLRTFQTCISIFSRIERKIQKRFKLNRKHSLFSLFVVLILIFSTEIITPNFNDPNTFYLSRIEQRMGEYEEPMHVAFDQLLSDYIIWHDEVTNSQNKTKTESVRILAWNGLGESGLGDKMRGILHAFMLAIETGRYFVIEDVPEFPLRKLIEPGDINWVENEDVIGDLKKEPLFNWRTSLSRGQQGIRRLSQPMFESRHTKHRVVRLASSTFPMYERTVSTTHWRFACRRLRPETLRHERCGYLGSNNMWYNRRIIQVLFKQTNKISEQIKSMKQMVHSVDSQLDGFKVIHARLGGKFRSEAKSKRFRTLNADWKATADSMLRCVDAGTGTVYLATDDDRFKEVFEHEARKFGSKVVFSPVKISHSGIVRAAEIEDALNDALVEAFFMGTADKLVTTGSGLANLAAFSGNTELVLLDECEQA